MFLYHKIVLWLQNWLLGIPKIFLSSTNFSERTSRNSRKGDTSCDKKTSENFISKKDYSKQ